MLPQEVNGMIIHGREILKNLEGIATNIGIHFF